jgi:hypothetical protein
MNTDPFFDELRSRLPGVDLVALPPELPVPAEPVDSNEAAARAESAVAFLRGVVASFCSRVSGDLPSPQTSDLTWLAGPIPGLVAPRLRAAVLEPAGPLARLDALARSLQGADRPASVRRHADTAVLTTVLATEGVRMSVIAQESTGRWTVLADGPPVTLGSLGATVRRDPPRAIDWGDLPR